MAKVLTKAWADYSSDEDLECDVPAVKAPTPEPSPRKPPRTEGWQPAPNQRRRRNGGHRAKGNKKSRRPNPESRSQAYERRCERMREMVLAQPGKVKEEYHNMLAQEERKKRHPHIPTVQYVHSILFTLMNERRGVHSTFEENGEITWGPDEEEKFPELQTTSCGE